MWPRLKDRREPWITELGWTLVPPGCGSAMVALAPPRPEEFRLIRQAGRPCVAALLRNKSQIFVWLFVQLELVLCRAGSRRWDRAGILRGPFQQNP